MTAMWLKCPEMNQTEWLNWRREGIGASDAPAIMEVSPWSTPFQIWESKINGKSSQPDNAAMARGRELEPVARAQLEKMLKVKLTPINIVNIENSWLRCSLDGIDDSGQVMVEIKCPTQLHHFVDINQQVPSKYFPQLQHQLAVTGLDGMYYFSFDGHKGTLVEVERDDAYIKEQLFPREKEFWDRVLAQEPPPLIAKDYVDMKQNPEWLITAKEWQENNQLLKTTLAQDKRLKDKLISLAKERSARGADVSLCKSICKGQIDYMQAFDKFVTDLKERYPNIAFPGVIWDSYRKESFIKWTLRGM